MGSLQASQAPITLTLANVNDYYNQWRLSYLVESLSWEGINGGGMIKVCPPWKLSIEGIISPNGGIGANVH
jgi:hypothetical protein